jgi:glycosyltransferase involved in cell wall biosynthesis
MSAAAVVDRESRWAGDRAPSAVPTLPGALVIDARALHASGIGRYLRELLACWLDEPPFEQLVLLGDVGALDAWREAVGAPRDRVHVVPHGGGFYSPAAQGSWLRARQLPAVRHARAAFFPHWDAPLVAMPRRAVVTVHDLIPFRVPEAFAAYRRALAAPALRRVLRTAARVLCVSEATARDVRAWYPRVAERLRVVRNGVSARFAAAPPAARLAPCPGPYLLCVGNQKAHKNLASAMAVLARLRARGHPELRMVVVGRRFDAAGAASRAAHAAGVGDALTLLGSIDDDALHACYAHSAALLFPSRYEGFGLPVLEAMAAGTPVVASSTPAVAEAAGDAASLHAPDDVEGMAAAVAALLDDPVLRCRAVARGRARAAQFRWRDAARHTACELQRVATPVGAR